MIKTQLYCGLSRKDGLDITEKQIEDFLQRFVAPEFDGFTVYKVTGYWQRVKEDSMVIEIIRDGVDFCKDWAIEEIGFAYAKLFNQDAVYRVDTDVRAHLITQELPKQYDKAEAILQ